MISSGLYTEEVLGAWDHTSIGISLQPQDTANRDEIVRAITRWGNAIDSWAAQPGHNPALANLNFHVLTPGLGAECVLDPGVGQLQLLQIPDVGDVCLIPPNQLFPVPDVIVVDANQHPQLGVRPGTFGIAPSNSGTTWFLRANNVYIDDGEIIPPVLVIYFSLGLIEDRFNAFAHEFGHSFGQGHTTDDAQLSGDIMHTPYQPSSRKCVSNLNMKALEEAYYWLPGPFQPPGTLATIDSTEYNNLLFCSP